MAPLPSNSTATYFVDYQFGAGQAHTFQVRFQAPETPATVAARVAALLDDLKAIRPASWVITGARVRAAGASISLPTTAPVIQAGTAGELSGINYPGYVDFVGRGSTSGRRVRWTLFGLNTVVPADYRYTGTEQPQIKTVLDSLKAGAPNVFLTVGGDLPTWQNYVNFGFNSYWERQQRG